MSADDQVSEEPQRTRDMLLDMASQLLLAVIVGLVMAVVANAFVEHPRQLDSRSATDQSP